ncbi:MAG TPA: DUF4835 family protein [Parafilimonas sp.]|nr:DUF4835 family protein [Parafilimonas sp.]
MLKKILFYITLLFFSISVHAQELQATVAVLAQQVGTSVDKSTFTTLQNQLTNFINKRKWTSDAFQAQEKIRCSFILTIQSVDQDNVCKATLAVQAARPVYNSAYQTALINYQDGDVTFKYVQFQQIDFNENRIQGTDALTANLPAVFAYYVYMILGFDYDSFSPKGGDDFFAKAQNIVNNAPEAKEISGWKSFDGVRNRYWLAENLMNNRYNNIHDIIYDYYRQGLDNMYQDDATARSNILESLSALEDFDQQNPNTMIEQFLVQGKSQEYIGIFKKSTPEDRSQAVQILSKLDVSNAANYKSALQ